MQEDNNNGKLKQELKFKYFINLGMNDDGSFALQTNVTNLVTGYGMLEFGKKGIDNHIMQLKKKNASGIVTPRGI